MAQFGFIGYGSMGSMLVKELIQLSKVKQEDIIVTRKHREKLEEVRRTWPQINITEQLSEIATQAKYIFLCMKPYEYKEVLENMSAYLTEDKHIISITGSLMIEDMECVIPCKITRLLPTLTSEVQEGITLICHNQLVTEQDKLELESLFSNFTKVFRVKESDYGFASEFTSCGPGFFASMLEEFVQAGLRYSDGLSREQVTELVMQTVYGTSRLMLENRMDFQDVIHRVATKGGITEEGVKIMRKGLPEIFDQVFDKTMNKRSVVEEELHQQFQKT